MEEVSQGWAVHMDTVKRLNNAWIIKANIG